MRIKIELIDCSGCIVNVVTLPRRDEKGEVRRRVVEWLSEQIELEIGDVVRISDPDAIVSDLREN